MSRWLALPMAASCAAPLWPAGLHLAIATATGSRTAGRSGTTCRPPSSRPSGTPTTTGCATCASIGCALTRAERTPTATGSATVAAGHRAGTNPRKRRIPSWRRREPPRQPGASPAGGFPNPARHGRAGWVDTCADEVDRAGGYDGGAVVQDIRFTNAADIVVRAPNVTIRRVELQAGPLPTSTAAPPPTAATTCSSRTPPSDRPEPVHAIRLPGHRRRQLHRPPHRSRRPRRRTKALGLRPGHPRGLLHQNPRRRPRHARVQRGPLRRRAGRRRRGRHRPQQHDRHGHPLRHLALVRRKPELNKGIYNIDRLLSSAAATPSANRSPARSRDCGSPTTHGCTGHWWKWTAPSSRRGKPSSSTSTPTTRSPRS